MPRICAYWEHEKPKVVFQLPKFRILHFPKAGVIAFSPMVKDASQDIWGRGTVLYIDALTPDELDALVDAVIRVVDTEEYTRELVKDNVELF